ncbi:hypothetical protein IFR05_006274 [Cadophora sp. M221]|nr:hypothetical protein IFR05_006274 [Cadophora sp. M221]
MSDPKIFMENTPPSSRKAFELLAQFSLLHNLGSQFLVALAMAMTFPTHNYHTTVVHLPIPTETRGEEKNTLPKSIIPEWITVIEELPFYIALSCNVEVVISSLCGMFWEAEIACNLVSPWLHPILNEVPEGKGIVENPGLYYEILAIIGGLRRPQISALFLGAAASGLMPTILRRIRKGRPPLDANAFPWTGCPQSFMDIPGSGPYICEGSADNVRRADVWRLLYLPPVVEDDLYYNSRPFTPWAPFGNSSVQNYQGFDKAAVQYSREAGSSEIELITSPEFPKIQLDHEASQEASLDIFRWVMATAKEFLLSKFIRTGGYMSKTTVTRNQMLTTDVLRREQRFRFMGVTRRPVNIEEADLGIHEFHPFNTRNLRCNTFP